jgi:thiol-disulfide isomerase/thioredoxin
MDAVSIGPLVMAADRFAVVLGVFIFTFVSGVLAHRVDQRFQAWSWWVLLGGIVAARLGHVAIHWRSFAAEPLRTLALWEGGFYWPPAAFAILLTVFLVLKTARQRLWSLLPLALALVVWNTAWQLTGGAQAIALPAKSFPTLAGQEQMLDGKTGKPMVINLWATWCPPCRREMPMMAQVAASSQAVDFVFANQGEGREAILRYLSREKIELETILLDQFIDLSRHYGAPGLPATLFIGADGVLQHAHLGEISREILQSKIARLSGEN